LTAGLGFCGIHYVSVSNLNLAFNRRHWLKTTGLGLAAGSLGWPVLRAADPAPGSPPGPSAFGMHLGLVTYNLAKDWDLATLIKNCEATGFEGVELRTTHAHGVEVSLSQPQRAEVKQRFRDSAVSLYGLGSTFDYHTPNAAKLRQDIEATKQYILLAADVGASGIKVRPNGFPPEVPREKTIEQIGRSLREVAEFGAQHGVVIRLEVHGEGTSLVPNIAAMLEVAGHRNVGACWNSNRTDLAGEGFDHNFDLLKQRIVEVHITELHDPGYPYRRLLQRLKEQGYTGFCLAEVPGSPDPLRLMRYYRALWLAYLS
jgi:sugar phosphate isomerase/epimerase